MYLGNFDIDQIREISIGTRDGLDVNIYAKPEFSWQQMHDLRQELLRVAEFEKGVQKEMVDYMNIVALNNAWLDAHQFNISDRGLTPLVRTILTSMEERLDQHRQNLYTGVELWLPDMIEQACKEIIADQDRIDFILNSPELCHQVDKEKEVLTYDEIIEAGADLDMADIAQDMSDFEESLIATRQDADRAYIDANKSLRDTEYVNFIGQQDMESIVESIDQYQKANLHVDNIIKIDDMKKQLDNVKKVDPQVSAAVRNVTASIRADINKQIKFTDDMMQMYLDKSAETIQACNQKSAGISKDMNVDMARMNADNCIKFGTQLKSELRLSAEILRDATNTLHEFNRNNMKIVFGMMDRISLGAFSACLKVGQDKMDESIAKVDAQKFQINKETDTLTVPHPTLYDKIMYMVHNPAYRITPEEIREAAAWKDGKSPLQNGLNKLEELKDNLHVGFALIRANAIHAHAKIEYKAAERAQRKFDKYTKIDRTIHDSIENINKQLRTMTDYVPYQKKSYEPSDNFKQVCDLMQQSADSINRHIDCFMDYSEIVKYEMLEMQTKKLAKQEVVKQYLFDKKENMIAFLDKYAMPLLNNAKQCCLQICEKLTTVLAQKTKEKENAVHDDVLKHMKQSIKLTKKAEDMTAEADSQETDSELDQPELE